MSPGSFAAALRGAGGALAAVDEVVAKKAANAFVDAGCDVVTCHVDGPKVVIETAEKRGVKTCGHNASQAPLAPKGFITGAEYKWETIYKRFAANLAKGEKLPNQVVGGDQPSKMRRRHQIIVNNANRRTDNYIAPRAPWCYSAVLLLVASCETG